MTQKHNYLKMARDALQRAESTMSPASLESLDNRQVLADISMLVRALNPDYFALPDIIDDDYFPFDEAH